MKVRPNCFAKNLLERAIQVNRKIFPGNEFNIALVTVTIINDFLFKSFQHRMYTKWFSFCMY